jgi:hypothetical protein
MRGPSAERARDLRRMEEKVAKMNRRLEIVQCPYSLFLSLRKYARIRHKPVDQVVKMAVSRGRVGLGCHSLWRVG